MSERVRTLAAGLASGQGRHMKYLVTGLVDVPGEGLREVEVVITGVRPGETPEECFERESRERGLEPARVIEVLLPN